MKIKPTFSVNFCYKCKAPVPRLGLSLRTKAGNMYVNTPFICPNCRRKKKR